MKALPATYRIGISKEDLFRSIQARFKVRTETIPFLIQTYYDTFDWRLFRRGDVIAATSRGQALFLSWESLEAERKRHLSVDSMPAFVRDLPDGPFRDALAPIIEMRRLLPLAVVSGRGSRINVLDGRDKTVARLELEEATVKAPGSAGPEQESPATLQVRPVRGYSKAARKLIDFVEGELKFEPVLGSRLQNALLSIGRKAGDYSSKLRLQLSPQMRSDEAVKAIHRALLGNILANREGVRLDLDSEFLHDFRVAVRRTRSALSQIKNVLPPKAVKDFGQEFRWLGTITGPARDLDVYLLKLGGYSDQLPATDRQHLAPLEAFLRKRKRAEHRDLVGNLDSARSEKLVRSWSEFLERPPAADTETAPHAGSPVLELASGQIWRAYLRVQKRARDLGPKTPADRLHRLRIECKKLRYLLEFFQSLYAPSDIQELVEDLKGLQDALGDFNDYQVQSETLRELAHQMSQGGAAETDTLLAMGRLIERLEMGQASERQRVARRYARFSRNQRCFQKLFAQGN